MGSPEWVAIVAPFASGLLGVGVAYGAVRANITALKERIDKAEIKLDNQVGEGRCNQMRMECKQEFRREIDRVSNHSKKST